MLHGGQPAPFRYKTRGEFVTLGHRKAVARVFGFELDGLAAWTSRRASYLAHMPSMERRIRLLLNWAAGAAFDRDVVQLGAEQHPDAPLADAAEQAAAAAGASQ